VRRGSIDLAACFQTVNSSGGHGKAPPSWPPAWRAKPRCRRVIPHALPPQATAADLVPDETFAHRRSEEQARLEAALFLAHEPLSTRKLAKLARLSDGTRARALIRELNAFFDADGSAFRVEWIAGGFQLLSRAAFGPWLRRLMESVPETRLSTAALETLAIVAYRQPVTRADLEAIRGVGCDEMLRHLLERELIAIGGRADELGRPNFYVTTRLFLQVFGLGHIDELPPIELPPQAGAADSFTAEDGDESNETADSSTDGEA
jgi:segregation and condensation protein B